MADDRDSIFPRSKHKLPRVEEARERDRRARSAIGRNREAPQPERLSNRATIILEIQKRRPSLHISWDTDSWRDTATDASGVGWNSLWFYVCTKGLAR